MIKFIVLPAGLISPSWKPTAEAIEYAESIADQIDVVDLEKDMEEGELAILLETPSAIMVPSQDGKSSPPPAAVYLNQVEQIALLGSFHSGPWRSLIASSLIDTAEIAVQRAIDDGGILLIVRA